MKRTGSGRELLPGDGDSGALVSEGPPQYIAVEASSAPDDKERSFAAALGQLWRRRWLIAAVTLAGAGLMVGIVKLLPTLYVGEARLLVGVQAPRVLNVEAIVADVSPDAERVQNESLLLQSRAIAGLVIAKLDLSNNPSFNPELRPLSAWSRFSPAAVQADVVDWVAGLMGRTTPPEPQVELSQSQRDDRLIDLLLASIDVSSLGRSHVLAIKAEAADPRLAAAIANTFAETYLDFQRREKLQTMDRVDKFLMDRIDELRDQVRRAEQAVEDYRRQHGLYKSGSGRFTTQQLAELNSQLIAAQTAKVEVAERLREAQELSKTGFSHETVPEVLRSPLIAALKQQQAEADRRTAEAVAQYGASHPRMHGVRAESAALSARVATEVGRVIDGLARDARTADARYSTLKEEFEKLKTQVGMVNDKSIQLEALERDATVHRNLLEAMLSRAKQTTGTASVVQPNAKLVSRAVPAEAPSYPPKTLLLVAGSMASLFIGCLLALLLEGNDRTFRRPDQIEAMTGLSVLSLVPQVRSRTAALQVLRQPEAPYSEALRRLFLVVSLSSSEIPNKTVLFSSATPAEGKSVMVASLGRLLAKSGKKVLVVDCDWRSPQLHRLFRCSNKIGLHDLLTDSGTVLNDCVQRDDASGAHIVPSGQWSPDAAHLLHSDRLRELLGLLSESYDVILLDCPPVLVTADALALSRLADAVVYVVRWGHTRQETAMEGLKQLHDCQANVVGIAVSRVLVREYRRRTYRKFHYFRAPMTG